MAAPAPSTAAQNGLAAPPAGPPTGGVQAPAYRLKRTLEGAGPASLQVAPPLCKSYRSARPLVTERAQHPRPWRAQGTPRRLSQSSSPMVGSAWRARRPTAPRACGARSPASACTS